MARDDDTGDLAHRTARFAELTPYKNSQNDAHAIPPGAMEMISAKSVFPIMSPEGWDGRNAMAAVKGAPGLTVSLAETPPGDCPGMHSHTHTVENFFCVSGRFRIDWGDDGEHSTILEPKDFLSVPPGIFRNFTNISDETAYLLVMIQTPPGDTRDEVVVAPAVAKELAEAYGAETVRAMDAIGVRFAPTTLD